jgi:hypothetical protein
MDSNDKIQTESQDEPVRKRMRPGKYLSLLQVEYTFAQLDKIVTLTRHDYGDRISRG